MEANDRQLAVCFLPDGRRLRGVDASGIIQTWDAATGKRLSRVEPQDSVGLSSNLAFSSDGKLLLVAGYGGVEFRDAETARPMGTWRLPGETKAEPYLDTLRGNSLLAAVDGTTGAAICVLHLPAMSELSPPVDVSKLRQQRQTRALPTTSPAVAVSAGTEADLKAPVWWLDRAEAEWNASTDMESRGRGVLTLMVARAAAQDSAGFERMKQRAIVLYPKPYADGFSPLSGALEEAATYQAPRWCDRGASRMHEIGR